MNRRKGLRYATNTHVIEIDVTWECNMKCLNCARLLDKLPSGSRMSMELVDEFVRGSIASKRTFTDINICGGEPGLHPDIVEIMGLIVGYKHTYSPSTRISLTTNEVGIAIQRIARVVNEYGDDIHIRRTPKKSRYQPRFTTVCIAPIDLPGMANVDYSMGCWRTSTCGISYSPVGYLPCACVSGAIDRAFGLGLALPDIPTDEQAKEILGKQCRYCGFFLFGERDTDLFGFSNTIKSHDVVSPSWERALERGTHGQRTT